MAYSKIEQAYVDGVVSVEFPDPIIEEPQQEQPMMLADSGQVKSDAQAGFGTIGPIPRNRAQEALGYVGELLTKAGVQLDKVGLDIPVLGRITLKDLTVGESGKVLEDMSYGFMPVEGSGGFISGTTRIKPDAALELLNLAPVVGAAAKVGGKAVVKGVQATKGLPVGMSIKEVGQGVDELGFYSAAQKAVDGIQQPKGTGDQFLKQIEKTPGVKPEEIKWTGLDDFLKSKKTVTKAEVQEYLDKNRVEVKEVSLSDSDLKKKFSVNSPEDQDYYDVIDKQGKVIFTGPEDEADYLIDRSLTKFSKYTLPGGENYREILLTLPIKNPEFDPKDLGRLTELSNKTRSAAEDVEYKALAQRYDASLRGETSPEFKSQHFDQPNILAHMRVNDRVDADGKKVLFVEEVQSDWHQAGRKKGYNQQFAVIGNKGERQFIGSEKEAQDFLAKSNNSDFTIAPVGGSGVPDAPFKTTWHELAMKRAIQMAAEGGYDRIAFTTGKTQAERYDLSKQISRVTYKDEILRAYDKDGAEVISKLANPESLEEYVGKELASKIVADNEKLRVANKAYRDAIKNDVSDAELNKLSQEVGKYQMEYKGVDLQVGCEGMKCFYDNIVPKFLDKYAKKWDAKTGMTKIRVATDKQAAEDAQLLNELGVSKDGPNAMAQVHYIDITPKMKESVVTQGQPLFAIGAGGAGAAATQEENK
jgi:hypothetical protein